MTFAVDEHKRRLGCFAAVEAVFVDAIFDVALWVFVIYGYDGVFVRTLNCELGVSHNLIV